MTTAETTQPATTTDRTALLLALRTGQEQWTAAEADRTEARALRAEAQAWMAARRNA